jgi:hypothetical protein
MLAYSTYLTVLDQGAILSCLCHLLLVLRLCHMSGHKRARGRIGARGGLVAWGGIGQLIGSMGLVWREACSCTLRVTTPSKGILLLSYTHELFYVVYIV